MDGEELADLDKLGPEKLLLRWMNYHLARAGYSKTVANFGKDISDSHAYLNLLAQIQPGDLSPPLSAFCVVRKYRLHVYDASIFPRKHLKLRFPETVEIRPYRKFVRKITVDPNTRASRSEVTCY